MYFLYFLGTDTEPHDRAIVRAISSKYFPNKKVKGDAYHTLFIGRLNPRTTQVGIHHFYFNKENNFKDINL